MWGPSSNIEEGNDSSTGTDQASFYGIASKATIRSTSLVDLATASGIADASRVEEGRKLLRRIAAMMTALSKGTAHVYGHTYSPHLLGYP
jgi:four helix bundle protein